MNTQIKEAQTEICLVVCVSFGPLQFVEIFTGQYILFLPSLLFEST